MNIIVEVDRGKVAKHCGNFARSEFVCKSIPSLCRPMLFALVVYNGLARSILCVSSANCVSRS